MEKLKYSEKDVFDIVDVLFHMFANSYRTEAKEELEKIIRRRMENSVEKEKTKQ